MYHCLQAVMCKTKEAKKRKKKKKNIILITLHILYMSAHDTYVAEALCKEKPWLVKKASGILIIKILNEKIICVDDLTYGMLKIRMQRQRENSKSLKWSIHAYRQNTCKVLNHNTF